MKIKSQINCKLGGKEKNEIKRKMNVGISTRRGNSIGNRIPKI